nr:DUF6266 family protein [uncultured Pedobacter sp.]
MTGIAMMTGADGTYFLEPLFSNERVLKDLNKENEMGFLNGDKSYRYTGKVGNLVSYYILEKNVVRMVGIITKPPSIKQLICRQEMAVVIKFLYPFTEFIRAGFMLKAKAAVKYPHNLAVRYNKMNALKGLYPNIEMDYPKAMVSQGSLLAAVGPTVEMVAEGLRFGWTVLPEMVLCEKRQRVMILVYLPDLEIGLYSINGARRSEGTELFALPAKLRGARMETYISFIATPGCDVANSVYVGRIN